MKRYELFWIDKYRNKYPGIIISEYKSDDIKKFWSSLQYCSALQSPAFH